MIDPEVTRDVWAAGIEAAIIAGLVEVLIHGLAPDREPRGFRFVPTTSSGWVGYRFRILVIISILGAFFGGVRYIHASVPAAGLASSFLLFINSAVHWRSHRALCVFGMIAGVIGLWLLVALYPVVPS